MATSQQVTYRRFEAGRFEEVTGGVVREGLVRLHVNGRELVAMMASPVRLDELALGFLLSEGIIGGLADVRRVVACPSGACVEVWLARADFEPPQGRTITSGCGGGITFADLTAAAQPVASDLVVGAGQLRRLMTAMQAGQRMRGSHTAALADGEELLLVAEDVGRHNTIDRIRGRCLLDGIVPEGKILLSTGRISSEMLHKAARMGTPVVASRTSPTSLSLALAEAWGITLVGYVRRDSLNIYTAPERVVVDSPEQAAGTPEEAWSDADA